MEINLIYISLVKSNKIETLSFKGNFMISAQIFAPVSVLSLIDIQKIAESYRRKSFGGTEKHNDRKDPNISYSFRPFWQSWKRENSCFFLRVNVSFFFQRSFTETRFLWFHVYETPFGIKASCYENPNIRFSLASKRFLETEYTEHSKTNELLPIVPMSGFQLELAL